MTLLKHITSFLLIVVIAVNCAPCYLMEDISHDSMVDLADAILQVRDFSRTADEAASFSFRMEKMVSTLCAVAGLKTLVNPNREDRSTRQYNAIVISPDKITNSFTVHSAPELYSTVHYSEKFIPFVSRSREPALPPPRIS